MKLFTKLACCAALSLLLVGSVSAQQKRSASENAALKARYGSNYEEILQKYGDDPLLLQQAADDFQASQNRRPFFFQSNLDDRYIVRSEAEPNNYFPTADAIDDVLSAANWRGDDAFTGGLIKGTFTPGDFDVYKFTVDTTKMYYFGASHSFLGDENYDEGTMGVSLYLFHESDLDTTYAENVNGITGNDKVRGDIQGRSTNQRANSGDFRLTGWVSPIDAATNKQLTGDFYLFIFNGGDEDQAPLKSLNASGTYHFSAYAVDLEDWQDKAEPNQNFTEAILNPNAILPVDGIVRSFMGFNPDTVKVVIPSVPVQGNSAYPQLLAQGDEDIDYYLLPDMKANHTLVVETMPFFGWYRDLDGSIGPGNTRWTDMFLRLYDADNTAQIADSDDNGREVQSANGQPNNIHSRIVYPIKESDAGGPLWINVSAWASRTRNPTQSVDNRDPGRFMYNIYAYQYSNDLVEANSEPNNTFADAMGIIARSNEPISGNFSAGGDVDVFRIFMHEMRMYNIVSYNSSVTGVIDVELYREVEDENGVKSLSSDLLAGTTSQGANGNDFRIGGFTPGTSGAFLLKLTGPSAGNYSLAVTEDVVFPRVILNEPNDTAPDAIANATIEVGVGKPRREGVIYPAGDVDHYVFQGLAGQQMNVKLQSIGYAMTNGDFRGVVNLLDGNLNTIATGQPASDALSNLAASLPADGNYILQVRAAPGTTAGNYGNNAVGLYSLNVGEPPREAEPNDTPEAATLLLDGFLAASLTSTDIDYFRISAKAGRVYHVRSANNGTGGTMAVDLFLASDPATSIYDGSGWEGRYSDNNFKVQIIPPVDADYLLKISPPGGGGGSYEIHMKSNDITEISEAYEPNNDAVAADAIGAIIPNGAVHRAMLYNPDDPRFFDDVDVYRVDIDEAGKTLVCESLPFDGPFWGRDSDMYSRLLASDGTTVLAENDDSEVTLEDGSIFDDWHTRVSHAVTEAGTYYCVFGSQDFLDDGNGGDMRDPTSGEYKFRISYTGQEAEPNDDFETATLVQNYSLTEATMTEGDVDVYQFNLKAGNIYHIRTFRSGVVSFGEDTHLYLSTDTSTDITDSETGGWRTRNNGNNIKLNLIPAEDATYYLRIAAPASLVDTMGTYQVLMKSNPIEALAAAGEPNNTFDEADLMAEHPSDGSVFQYMLYDENGEDFHDDLDYYTVMANPGDILIAETLPFDGPTWPRDFDSYMYMYGPDRAQVGSNDDNSVTLEDGSIFDDWHSRIEYTVQTAGMHYILVVGQDASVPPRNQTESRWRDPARGEYKFRLTKLTGVSVEGDEQPAKFELFANYPNPFNPTTTIEYQLPESVPVKLEVFNILGQQVATLVDELQPAGRYSIRFDAAGLSSGMYLYRIKAGKDVRVKKMLLMK